jgi:hypothetical protein
MRKWHFIYLYSPVACSLTRPRTSNLHYLTTLPYRVACLALVALLFVACTSVPISSMYSLSKLDPMKTDPEQIRVAIRVNESVNAAHGSAQITIGFKSEDDGINEELKFDVQLTSAQTLTPKLTRGMLPGEQVTVMSLSAEDARSMQDLQQRLYTYKAADINGEGSFGLRFGELCLDKELPAGDIPLTLFLKTENHEDYIVFIKTELHDLFSDSDSDIDAVPFCDEMVVEDAVVGG